MRPTAPERPAMIPQSRAKRVGACSWMTTAMAVMKSNPVPWAKRTTVKTFARLEAIPPLKSAAPQERAAQRAMRDAKSSGENIYKEFSRSDYIGSRKATRGWPEMSEARALVRGERDTIDSVACGSGAGNKGGGCFYLAPIAIKSREDADDDAVT